MESKATGELTPTLLLPFYPIVYCMAVCFFGICLAMVVNLLQIWMKKGTRMNPVHIGIIGIVVLVAILFSKFPVAFCMALVGVVGFGYLAFPRCGTHHIFIQDFWFGLQLL